MRNVRVAVLLSVVTVVIHLPIAYAQTQDELAGDACAYYRKARQAMESAYRQLLKDYKSEQLFLAKIKAAQGAWMRYRDAHIQALYPDPDPSAYGTVLEMCKCQLLAEMTTARLKQLEQWTIGVEEGEVCAGSRKTRDSR